jgi:hypothetical protein
MIETAIGLVEASILPAVVVLVALFALRQSIAARQAPGWSYPIIFAIAYCAGAAIDVRFDAWPTIRADWAAWPIRNWQWMFYLAPLAAIVGASANAARLPALVRWLLVVAVSIVAAWLLTGIRSLPLPRPVTVALLSTYFVLLAALAEPLATRIRPAALLSHFVLAAAALAAMISFYANQTHGQLAATAAAALTGAAIFAWLGKQAAPPRGMAIAFAIVLGGWAVVEFLAFSNLAAMLLLPAAPLAAWASFIGLPARSSGAIDFAIQTAAVTSVILLAIALLRIVVGA